MAETLTVSFDRDIRPDGEVTVVRIAQHEVGELKLTTEQAKSLVKVLIVKLGPVLD